MKIRKLWTTSAMADIQHRLPCMRLVLANGCFDYLHAGHIHYLRTARAMGDALLVLLNSDESVRKLKGPARPLQPEPARAYALDALECVSAIYIFDELRITGWLERIRPYVWAKGGDYQLDTLDSAEVAAAKAAGTRIEIIPRAFEVSTSELVRKEQEAHDMEVRQSLLAVMRHPPRDDTQ